MNFKLKKTQLLIGLSIAILALLSFTTIIVFTVNSYTDKIYPNTFVDDIDVSGKTKDEANELLSEFKRPNNTISIVHGSEVIKTFSLDTNTLYVDENAAVEKSFNIGRSANIITNISDAINTTLKFKANSINSELKYSQQELAEFITDLETRFNSSPQNAIFEYTDNRVTRIEKDISGKKIDTQKLLADFEQSIMDLNNSIESKTIELKIDDVKAEKVLSEINDFGIEDLIGEGQSNYSGSGETRVFNLKLAAAKFNGVIIPEGGTISFGEIVGEISGATGYKEGYIISGGRTVLEAGGGVCQVSTTLFRAALNTGLSIKEWYAHAYRVKYYENDSLPGMDSTIYLPYVDLKIDNNTKGALLIMVEYEEHNNVLRMKLYGQKDDRKVEVSPVEVYDEQAAPAPKYIADPSLRNGEVRQIDWAASGAKTRFTYKVNIDGKEVINREFLSNFQPWQAVYLVGTGN